MPETKGRADFVFHIMMRREIQVSVGMGWLPININDSNTVSSGNQGVQEGNLTIVFNLTIVSPFRIYSARALTFLHSLKAID